MDEPAKKRAGRQNQGPEGDRPAVGQNEPCQTCIVDDQARSLALDQIKPLLGVQSATNGLAVEFTIGLSARAAHRRSLAPVEHAELDPCLVGGEAHQSIESIHLAHQMAFAKASDGWVA